MAELRYTFKHDILFKMFFLRHQEQLKFLIALILRIPLGSITEFMIINTEMPPEAIGGKFSHLDINIKVNGKMGGRLVIAPTFNEPLSLRQGSGNKRAKIIERKIRTMEA